MVPLLGRRVAPSARAHLIRRCGYATCKQHSAFLLLQQSDARRRCCWWNVHAGAVSPLVPDSFESIRFPRSPHLHTWMASRSYSVASPSKEHSDPYKVLGVDRSVDAEALKKAELRQPSEKQLQYAEALAEQLGRELPDSAKLDAIECSEFVDQCRAKIPPSEKQVAFAQRIASEAGIDLPESALISVQKCSEYINANMHLLPTQDREPTERQVASARRISEATGIELPPTVTSSALACSDYIDANIQLFNEKSNQMVGNDKLPTQRQLAFAQKISREGGIPLPPSATSSSTACSEFIDGNIHLLSGSGQMRGSEEGSSPPSQRQLLYAVSLARQRNLGLSAEVLKDRNALSQFIDSCLGGNAGLPQAKEVNLRSNDSPPDAADSDAIINRSPPRPSSVDNVDAALLDPLADKLVNSAPRTD